MKFKVSLDKSIQMALADAADRINAQTAEAAIDAVRDTAMAAYDKAKTLALARLNSTAEQYINALEFTQIAPNVWSVGLREEAQHLEEGYTGFDMKPGLLKNAKKISKQGFKYRSIPMEKKSTGKGKAGTTTGDMLNDLKRLRGVFGDKGTTKDANGKPILGKTLSFNRDQVGRWSMKNYGTGEVTDKGQVAMSEGSGYGKHLEGVVKYQYQTKSGGVRSQFITFRTVSENPKYKDKWIHKGFGGIHLFRDLEDFAYRTLEQKLREIFG